MAQLSYELSQAADRNRELLEILERTEYAVSGLKQNTQSISDLRMQIVDMKWERNRLHDLVEKHQNDKAKSRSGFFRGGRKTKDQPNAEQEQEDKEFLDSWQREREANAQIEELKHAFEAAQAETPALERDFKIHEEAQTEIDEMYEEIFASSTSGIPGENEKKQVVSEAQAGFEHSQMKVANDKSAMDSLERAREHLRDALFVMKDAHHTAKLGLLGGGRYLDAKEQSLVSAAHMSLIKCNAAIDDARKSQPGIGVLNEVNFVQGNRWRDILFSAFFTDISQHKWVKEVENQVGEAGQRLHTIIEEQQQELSKAESALEESSKQLAEARRRLQQVRSKAFENMAGSGMSDYNHDMPPPVYR